MNCEVAEEKILEAMDGPLSAVEGAALEAHVAGCESCAGFRAIQVGLDGGLVAHFESLVTDEELLEKICDAVVDPVAAPVKAWLPDVLNAAGATMTVASFGLLNIESPYRTMMMFGLLMLLGITCYPLFVARDE